MSDSEFSILISELRGMRQEMAVLRDDVNKYHVNAVSDISAIMTRCEERHEKEPESKSRSWKNASVVFAILMGIGSLAFAVISHFTRK